MSTFNFLNSEARRVGGAFIPPTYMTDVDEVNILLSFHHKLLKSWVTTFTI